MGHKLHDERLMQAQASVEHAAKEMHAVHRQRYHFMAPAYWINDPNGLIYYKGKYHLFYQHNPYSPKWGAMHWGHAASDDLVHWDHLPVALAPSEWYDDHPQGGVFSGSTVADGDIMYAFYTGTSHDGNEIVQAQCRAISYDCGVSFVKDGVFNPVIRELPPGASGDFRDPKVFCHNRTWYMVLGSSLGKGAWHGGEGCAQMYRSRDLIQWEYSGVIARSNGEFGTMWECPDLFPLCDKWVLTFSPMFAGERKAVYLVGDMDFESSKFTWETQGEVDWGREFYAPQSVTDDQGRTFLIAWQNGWDWMPWWKGFGPTDSENWCGAMTLPREVRLDADQRLSFRPVKMLESLRSDFIEEAAYSLKDERYVLSCRDPERYELELGIDLFSTTARYLHLYLRAAGDRYTRLTLDFQKRELTFDRNASDHYSQGSCSCQLELKGRSTTLRIFSDTSSIEVFADEGRATMCNTIYPTFTGQQNYLQAQDGVVQITHIYTWDMNGGRS